MSPRPRNRPQPRDRFVERLRAALRAEPARASDHFTASVLSRLDRPRRLRFPLPRLAALAAATLAVAAGLVVWRGDGSASRAEADAAARRQLIEEYRQIETELHEIRRLADESDPVLYLGGDEKFDLVYDLESYESGSKGDVRAASLPDRG